MGKPQMRYLVRRLMPSWLRGDRGEAFMYSLALPMDLVLDHLHQGVAAKMPTFAPDDAALARIGRDRLIMRGPTESRESYVTRLIAWRKLHQRRGNAFSVLENLAPMFPAMDMHIVSDNGTWATRTAAGVEAVAHPANWSWDGTTDQTRKWLILEPPGGVWDPIDWADVTWDDLRWGGPTAQEVDTMRAILSTWGSAGSICEWIIVAHDLGDFGPEKTFGSMADGTWGQWSTTGDNRGPVRTSAFYYVGSA